jgi:integrase
MARPSKPRYRRYGPGRGAWVATIAGEYHTLASGPRDETRKAAMTAFHALMAAGKRRAAAGVSLEAIAEAFLDAAERDLRPLTVEFYVRHVRAFWGHVGAIAAADVRPYHVARWLDAHRWGPTTRHGAVTAVRRLFRWAKQAGHLDADPLEGLERPTPSRRREVLTAAQAAEVLDAATDRAFAELLEFARLTGCRPSEAMAVEARHVNVPGGVIVMESKTTGATGRERVIHLTPAAAGLCRGLMARHPEGPLLRNRDGRPWTRNATACRFARMRKRLGLGPEATLESFRHLFITDGLEAGVPIKTMAELAGHASTAMIDRHYSQLHRRRAHLAEAAAKVRPDQASK